MSVSNKVIMLTGLAVVGVYALQYGSERIQKLDVQRERTTWKTRAAQPGVYMCETCADGWLPGECLDEKCQAKDFVND